MLYLIKTIADNNYFVLIFNRFFYIYVFIVLWTAQSCFDSEMSDILI